MKTMTALYLCFIAIFNSLLVADAALNLNRIQTKAFPFVGKCVQISLPSKNLCYSLVKGGASLGANIVPCNAADLSQRVCVEAGNGNNFLIGTRDCQHFLDNHSSMDGPGLMYLEPRNIRTQEFKGTLLPAQGPTSYFFNLVINGYGMGYSGGPGPVRGPRNTILQRAARQNDVGWKFVELDCFPERQVDPVVTPVVVPVVPVVPVVVPVTPVVPVAPVTPTPTRRCRK